MGKKKTLIYALPTSVDVNGKTYQIESDYRAVLDILTALADNELDEQEKAEVSLRIFYPGFDEMPVRDYQEALNQCFRFIDRGKEREEKKKEPVIMSWEQDFDMYIAPINRIAGCDVRSLEYVHWWTFLTWYVEIGDCFYAQVVRIRDKKAHGKSLDKQDREFYKRNRAVIDLKTADTQAEKDVLAAWGIST